MTTWTRQTEIIARRLPSGAWVRTDQVNAVEERHGSVWVILAFSDPVKAGTTAVGTTVREVAELIWKQSDE